MSELKPCPLCGEEVELEYYPEVPKFCPEDECVECGCCDYCEEFYAVSHVCNPVIVRYEKIFATEDEAIEGWNGYDFEP